VIALAGSAAGIAAGVGAAQLGLGYGLGTLVWPATASADDSVWLGSLGWATWIAAGATAFGALGAARLGGTVRPGGPWRLTLAAAAAVGAVLTVALVAIPAGDTVRVDTFSPLVLAAGYTIIGILLGLPIAYWAIVSRPVATNLLATASFLWVLAVVAVTAGLISGRSVPAYLTSWQFAGGTRWYGTFAWPDSALILLAALIVGGLAAWPAVRDGRLEIDTAVSGAAGPLLVAAVYLVQAPELGAAPGPIGSAYLTAPYAVVAGLGGSAAAVAIGRWMIERRVRRAGTVRLEPVLVARGTSPVAISGPEDEPADSTDLLGSPEASASPSEASVSFDTAGSFHAGDSFDMADSFDGGDSSDTGVFYCASLGAATALDSPAAGPAYLPRTSGTRRNTIRRMLGGGSTSETAAPDHVADCKVTGTARVIDGQFPTQSLRRRSTVARPPAEPPIAKINPPH
jgi:hypothetical protein